MTNFEHVEGLTVLPIAAVERDTGLSKDTLRVWEKRYGFPRPNRDVHGERCYSLAQVEKLRLIKRLLDQGMRPGKIMGASAADLATLLEHHSRAPSLSREAEGSLESLLEALKRHRADDVRSLLHQLIVRRGLRSFVLDTVAPMNRLIGEAWLRGEIQVHEEHLYSEQVQNVLRGAIQAQPFGRRPPHVLLTTFPEEEHAIGLLMVEAMLVCEGASSTSLGIRTPLPDIRSAALSTRADVVALSFSAAYPARQAVAGLSTLRAALPQSVQIWAGGAGIRGRERQLAGVQVMDAIDDISAAVQSWRNAHDAAAG